MASAELSRRVRNVVAYPPISTMSGAAARVPRGAARSRRLRGPGR